MTVSSRVSSIIYVGDGQNTEFDVPFRFLEDSDLKLSIQATDGTVTNLVLNIDYVVTGANADNGGKVHLTHPVGNQAKLSILRVMDLLQETDYRENERFPAESHERALDKLTFETQQLQAQLDRAIKVDVFSDVDPDVLRQHIERVWDSVDNIDIVANDKANMDTVALSIADVNTVAGDIDSVVTTATNVEDVKTVAQNKASLNVTAANITDVKTVAKDIASVNTTATNIEDVKTNATNITDINTNAANIGSINQVAEIRNNVTLVALNNKKVTTVADNIDNVNVVAGISSDVTTVAGISGDVTSVSGIRSDVTSVADNATNINTVADISSKVSNVAAISSDVTEVAGIRMDVQTVSLNSSAVTTAADNIAVIQASPTAASNAATSANNASIWAEGTDEQVEALGGVHSSKVWAAVSAAGQIQSDWDQTDDTKKDYIRNKPFIPTQAGDIGAVEANAGITGATHTKITYDAKGLVTAGADLEEADIPSLHLDKVTDVTATATELNYVTGATSNIQNQLNDRVTLGTAQTISGSKRFTQPSGDMSIELMADTNQQTVPSNNGLRQIALYRNATYTKGDGYTCWIQGYRGSDGRTSTAIYTRRFLESDSQEILNYLQVTITADGTPACYTRTPPANSAGDEIATAGWFRLPNCGVRTVIETYRSGENWYRVWSDGWIEQGGAQTNNSTGSNSYTVSLIRAFATADYTVMRAPVWGGTWGNGTVDGYTTGIFSKTKTTFTCATHATSVVSKIMWYACGY